MTCGEFANRQSACVSRTTNGSSFLRETYVSSLSHGRDDHFQK